MIRIALVTVALCSLIVAGCTPRVIVKRSCDTHDRGIRYYRPKPYLFISPIASKVVLEEKDKPTKTTTSNQSDEFVSIEMQMLPDFNEEYSIDVRPGMGTADVSFTLKDGWMLTELNQNLDSQVDENIKATAELLTSAGSLASGVAKLSLDEGRGDDQPKKIVVQATNVPLGYYESVISCGANGKRMAGWRYVGFAPFNSCAPAICDSSPSIDCNDPHNGPVYGLAFVRGVMCFQRLTDLQRMEPVESITRVDVPVTELPDRENKEGGEDSGDEELNKAPEAVSFEMPEFAQMSFNQEVPSVTVRKPTQEKQIKSIPNKGMSKLFNSKAAQSSYFD